MEIKQERKEDMMPLKTAHLDEWLEADGLGGFAMGTVSGVRSRRYHALLQVATNPPMGRMVLINGIEVWFEIEGETFPLSAHRYEPDVIYPTGFEYIESFKLAPWPTWVYRLPNGTRLKQEIFVPHEHPAVALSWKLLTPGKGRLRVRPLVSGRDYHQTHHENPAFQFEPIQTTPFLTWRPYAGVPAFSAVTNGAFSKSRDWYRNFLYSEEKARGLDAVEDLATVGDFEWSLGDTDEASLIFLANGIVGGSLPVSDPPEKVFNDLRRAEEVRRKKFRSNLHRAADSYIVRRGRGKTIIAGYPWFTDWGRDSFIALRGLCLAGDRLGDAREILLEWACSVSEGMLPNYFPDGGSEPEYNSIDASLWFVIAVHDFFKAMEDKGRQVPTAERARLISAVQSILTGYQKGTRFGIHMDTDGLIAGGVHGVALTWMDARVEGRSVTPRIGKPVEVQALWLNALKIGTQFSEQWESLFKRGKESFGKKFWNEEKRFLNDVVDVDYQPGKLDSTLRPNQILAVGGLPYFLMDGSRAKSIVDQVQEKLWTPMGLRSLAPGEPGYAPRYEGSSFERDQAYHQGPVWPWLLGPFIDAWVRVRGGGPVVIQEARNQFLEPLKRHLSGTGLGHVSEIADAEAPFTPRGCPFQAWSLAELMRLEATCKI